MEHQLHRFGHEHAVHCRFSPEEAGLAVVSVVGDCSAQVQAGGATDHGRESVAARTVAVGYRGVSQMPQGVLIAIHQTEGATSQGEEPIFVLDIAIGGARPSVLTDRYPI